MTKNCITGLLFMFTLLCGFSSCEDEPWREDEPQHVYNLFDCAWVDYFVNDYDEDCKQTLEFFPDGRGMERMEYKSYGSTTHKERAFVWEWDKRYPYSMFIDYLDGSESYFADLQISPNRLRGFLDDEDVMFDAVY